MQTPALDLSVRDGKTDNSRPGPVPAFEHRVIKKILAHLGLLRGGEQKCGPPTPPKKCSEIVIKPFDDGWPAYEESFTMVQG
jgi:hypothetical protein